MNNLEIEIAVASWSATGRGTTAGSRLFIEVHTQYGRWIIGILRYSGHSATGNKLDRPHFGDEKEHYESYLDIIDQPVQVHKDKLSINIISRTYVQFNCTKGSIQKLNDHQMGGVSWFLHNGEPVSLHGDGGTTLSNLLTMPPDLLKRHVI